MTISRLWAAPLLGASLLALGCASSRDGKDDEVNLDEQMWVKQPVFEQMAEVVKSIHYLPFRYKVDGCYARALYMSMELAAEGLESNAIFAFAQPGAPLVVGPIQWGYHVTPLLNVGPDEDHLTPMVFDPAIQPTPMTRDRWVELMGHGPDSPRPPALLMVPGSKYGPAAAAAESEWANRDLPNFESLPAFRTRDVQSACGVMYRYLRFEPPKSPATTEPAPLVDGEEQEVLDPVAANSPLTAEEKRELLVARTEALVAALTAKSKLEDDAVFSAARCRSGF